MAISLYDMSVPTYLQTLGAVSGFLDKGLAHCKECGAAPGEVVEHRLFQDMAGWTPHYTSTGVDQKYQPLCFGPFYIPSAGMGM